MILTFSFKSNFKLDIPNYVVKRNDRPIRQGGGVAILLRHNINFGIIDTCSNLDTENEALTITLEDSQFPTSISTIYIPPGSTINTILLSNITNSADNVIINGDLNAKHLDFNYTKTDKWGIALKKAYIILISLLLITAYIPTETAEQTLVIFSII